MMGAWNLVAVTKYWGWNEERRSTSLKVTAFKLDPERQTEQPFQQQAVENAPEKREAECINWQQMVLLPRVLEHTQGWKDKLESCSRKDLSAGWRVLKEMQGRWGLVVWKCNDLSHQDIPLIQRVHWLAFHWDYSDSLGPNFNIIKLFVQDQALALP